MARIGLARWKEISGALWRGSWGNAIGLKRRGEGVPSIPGQCDVQVCQQVVIHLELTPAPAQPGSLGTPRGEGKAAGVAWVRAWG